MHALNYPVHLILPPPPRSVQKQQISRARAITERSHGTLNKCASSKFGKSGTEQAKKQTRLDSSRFVRFPSSKWLAFDNTARKSMGQRQRLRQLLRLGFSRGCVARGVSGADGSGVLGTGH